MSLFFGHLFRYQTIDFSLEKKVEYEGIMVFYNQGQYVKTIKQGNS